MSRIEVELIAPPTAPAAVSRVEKQPVQAQPAVSRVVKPPVQPQPVVPHVATRPVQPKPAPPTAPPQLEPVLSAPTQLSPPLNVSTDKSVSPKTVSPIEAESLAPPRFNAAYLNNTSPAYPVAARRLGYEGTVVIRARIQIDGSADRVEIKKSSGHGILDQAALEAVRKWRFIPAKRGSEAVVEWVEIPWQFKLEE